MQAMVTEGSVVMTLIRKLLIGLLKNLKRMKVLI
jgi:hypothetical protein